MFTGEDFDSFFGGLFGHKTPTVEEHSTELDNLWKSYDLEKYWKKVNVLKTFGYRILRNSSGKHKVMLKEK